MRLLQRFIPWSSQAEMLEARLGGVVNSAMDAIISVDDRHRVILFNSPAERMFDCPAAQAFGQPLDRFIPQPFCRQCLEYAERLGGNAAHGPISPLGLISGLRGDGEAFPIEASPSQVKIAGRKVFTMTLRDITERNRTDAALRAGEGRLNTEITERKQAEIALRKSELQLQTIIENIDEGVAAADLDGQLLHFNRAALKMHGYSSLDECRRHVTALVDTFELSDSNGVLLTIDQWPMARVLRGEVLHDVRLHVRRFDSPDHRVFSYSGNLVHDAKGEPLMAILTIDDITERNGAEEALRRSQAQLETIIENLSEGVVVSDLGGQLTLFNRAAFEMHGYTSPDEWRRNIAELVDTFELIGLDGAKWPPEQWPMARVLRGDVLQNLEATIRRCHTGWERVFSFGGGLIRDAGGRPLMGVVTTTDITERRKAESAAILLAAIVESSSDAVIGVDLNDVVTSWNVAAEQIFGYTADEMKGRSVFTLIPPGRLDEEHQILATAKQGGRVEHFETERLRKGDEIIFISVTVSSIKDSHGRVIGVSKVARDISERKRSAAHILQLNTELEQRVAERTAELKNANKELEAFSYSVSHDLRAPLRSLDGFSQALMEDAADKLDDEAKDNLRRIRAASQRMGQLIDDLLNLAQLTRTELVRQAVDLTRIASDVVAELRAADPARAPRVTIAEGLAANADPQLIRIVLTNLIGNAWKFTSKCAHAHIEFGREIDADGAEAFFVRDNGAGFDMAYAGKLFGAFQRLHALHDYKGTGIGLATVQRIIHRHGGRIRARGALNVGAEFHFTL